MKSMSHNRAYKFRKVLYFFISFVILLFLLLIPFNFVISPERKFKVFDDKGIPISGVVVKQIWDQYALQYTKEDQILPSPDGSIIIPRRTVKTRWIDLLIGAVTKIATYKINASIGSSDSIFIDAIGYETKWFFDGEGLGNTVVLKRQ
jgi:hypothetical protein